MADAGLNAGAMLCLKSSVSSCTFWIFLNTIFLKADRLCFHFHSVQEIFFFFFLAVWHDGS